MNLIQETPRNSILYEDNKVIVALAFEPFTRGHCVVIWKGGEEDINELSTENYEYLMDVVNVTRDTLLKFYGVEKVYLMYLDESNWVHWHLVPRYDEKGVSILSHKDIKINDFENAEDLSNLFKEIHQKMIIEN